MPEDGAHDVEHGRRGADADGENEDDEGREGRRAAEHPDRVLQVAGEIIGKCRRRKTSHAGER